MGGAELGRLPDEALAALAAPAGPEGWQAVIPLLTVGADEFPHVCLLAAPEIDAGPGTVRLALSSAGPIANLKRSGQAVLAVMAGDAAWYARLRLAGTPRVAGSLTGVVLVVEGVRRDSVGVPLRPPVYRLTADLPVAERWAECARLLAELR